MKKFFAIFSVVLFSCVNIQSVMALSKDDIGITTAQFLKLGIGAQSAGMGKAVTCVANGTDSIYSNPANLNCLDKIELSFSHTMWFEDVNYEWFAIAIPTQKAGTFGLGLQYVSYGSLDKFDNANTFDGSFSPLDIAGYLSYVNFYERLDFDFNIKYIYSKIEQFASTFALDIGTTYTLNNARTSIGVAISKLGEDMKFNYKTESLPFLFKLGIAHYILEQWLFALDLNFPNDNEFYVNVGTQYCVEVAKDIDFTFMAGYEGRNKDIEGFNWINLGFGIK